MAAVDAKIQMLTESIKVTDFSRTDFQSWIPWQQRDVPVVETTRHATVSDLPKEFQEDFVSTFNTCWISDSSSPGKLFSGSLLQPKVCVSSTGVSTVVPDTSSWLVVSNICVCLPLFHCFLGFEATQRILWIEIDWNHMKPLPSLPRSFSAPEKLFPSLPAMSAAHCRVRRRWRLESQFQRGTKTGQSSAGAAGGWFGLFGLPLGLWQSQLAMGIQWGYPLFDRL